MRKRDSLNLTPVLLLAVCVTGCSSLSYKAASLPAEFRIPPSQDGGNVDLSRLAMPSEPSSVIGPGDVLDITLATGYEQQGLESVLVRVNENGVANIPLVGEVDVAGLEPAEAEQTIATASVGRGVFRRPHVTVLIERKQMNHVTVVGAVEEPGVVELDRSNSDLLGALAKAGGLTEEAGTEVQIHRKTRSNAVVPPSGGHSAVVQSAHFAPPAVPQPLEMTSQQVDLSDIPEQGFGNYQLGDGDVVMVFENEPRKVHVMGLVQNPKQIEIPPREDLRVLDALAMAGGRTIQLADKVKVIRHIPGQPQPIVVAVSVREAKRNGAANLVLAPEDVVTVEETPVTLVFGAVQSLVRIGVSGSTPLF